METPYDTTLWQNQIAISPLMLFCSLVGRGVINKVTCLFGKSQSFQAIIKSTNSFFSSNYQIIFLLVLMRNRLGENNC